VGPSTQVRRCFSLAAEWLLARNVLGNHRLLLRKKPAYYAMSRVLRPTAVGVRRKYRDCSVCHARPAKVLPWELWVVSSKMTEVVADVELRFISISTGNDIKKKITKRITITSTAQLMLRMVLLTTCQKSHMFLLLGFGLTGYACLVIWSRSRSSTSRLRIEGLKFLNMGMSCWFCRGNQRRDLLWRGGKGFWCPIVRWSCSRGWAGWRCCLGRTWDNTINHCHQDLSRV